MSEGRVRCDREVSRVFWGGLDTRTKRRSGATSPGSVASSPESVEESFHAAGRLVLQDFDAAFHLLGGDNSNELSPAGGAAGRRPEGGCAHVDLGRLGERADGVDVVVEDDDPDHHPQAEGNRLLAGEAAAVLPGGAQSCVSATSAASGRARRGRDTHGVSSMTLHTVAMVLRQSVVFSMGRFLFCGKDRPRRTMS